MIFHFQGPLKRLDLWRVLVLRRQHDDRNSDFGRVVAVHQRGMDFRCGTEGCILSGAKGDDLVKQDLGLTGFLCADCQKI
jgi:hypothetical protein